MFGIPKLDPSELTIENGFFKHFDFIIRKQLEPVWLSTSSKTKQLVNDLQLLRNLCFQLVLYSCL